MSNEIIQAESEYEHLKKRIAEVRAAVSLLTAQRDELRYRECPRLEAEYNTRIGVLELRVFQARARVLELRRAIEILQAARNRQEQTSAEEAQKKASDEYSEYEQRIREEAERMQRSADYKKDEDEKDDEWRRQNGANGGDGQEGAGGDGDAAGSGQTGEDPDGEGSGQGSDGKTSGPEGSADDTESGGEGDDQDEMEGSGGGRRFRSREDELKHYYRKLMKLLHPDSHPDQTPEDAQLLQQVMEAYRNGDLERLKALYSQVGEGQVEEEFSNTPDGIRRMKELLAELDEKSHAVQEEIRQIQRRYADAANEFLADEEAVAARQKELAVQYQELMEQYQKLKIRFDRLKEGKDPDGEE